MRYTGAVRFGFYNTEVKWAAGAQQLSIEGRERLGELIEFMGFNKLKYLKRKHISEDGVIYNMVCDFNGLAPSIECDITVPITGGGFSSDNIIIFGFIVIGFKNDVEFDIFRGSIDIKLPFREENGDEAHIGRFDSRTDNAFVLNDQRTYGVDPPQGLESLAVRGLVDNGAKYINYASEEEGEEPYQIVFASAFDESNTYEVSQVPEVSFAGGNSPIVLNTDWVVSYPCTEEMFFNDWAFEPHLTDYGSGVTSSSVLYTYTPGGFPPTDAVAGGDKDPLLIAAEAEMLPLYISESEAYADRYVETQTNPNDFGQFEYVFQDNDVDRVRNMYRREDGRGIISRSGLEITEGGYSLTRLTPEFGRIAGFMIPLGEEKVFSYADDVNASRDIHSTTVTTFPITSRFGIVDNDCSPVTPVAIGSYEYDRNLSVEYDFPNSFGVPVLVDAGTYVATIWGNYRTGKEIFQFDNNEAELILLTSRGIHRESFILQNVKDVNGGFEGFEIDVLKEVPLEDFRQLFRVTSDIGE